ncbi:hypothetical protein FACS1894181_16780 [Bacteroidia bacterium]|nr:hypothetical protein FACS1894181_16780 [Bacteroidia bacterium]
MLNKDEILRRTNKGLDVFKHYIPGYWRIGRNFLNPLYEDRKASCNIYFDRGKEMHAYLGEKAKEEKEKRKEVELSGIAKTIFANRKHCTCAELCGQVQTLLDVRERTAKSYIRFMKDREIILKDPVNQNHFIVGHING